MKRPLAAEWAALEDHFQHQAKLVDRLREAGRDGVLRMWASQTNETASAFRDLSVMLF